MAVLESEVLEAFRSLGVDEEKAVRAAASLSRPDPDWTSWRAKVDAHLAKVDERLAALDTRVTVLTWMVGVVITQGFAVLFLVLRNALR